MVTNKISLRKSFTRISLKFQMILNKFEEILDDKLRGHLIMRFWLLHCVTILLTFTIA